MRLRVSRNVIGVGNERIGIVAHEGIAACFVQCRCVERRRVVVKFVADSNLRRAYSLRDHVVDYRVQSEISLPVGVRVSLRAVERTEI